MSGLLVKSTLIMKENLQLMHGRGLDIPVILGGAALTRRYVEHDLREIYGPNVAYAGDAFDGLHYMERLVGGESLAAAGAPEKALPAESDEPASTEERASGDAYANARRRTSERGAVRVRPAVEDELEALADIMGVMAEDLQKADINELVVAELNESVIGGGRVHRVDEGVYELANIAMLPEQWKAGAGMDLVRAMRRVARGSFPDAAVYVTCDPADTELARFYRTLGFDQVPVDDPRAAIANDTELLRGYFDANRSTLLTGGKKSVALSTGMIGVKKTTAKVVVADVDALLKHLEDDRKLRRFIRSKSEVDRAALLAEPKVAVTIPGVSIDGGDDAFFVKPLMVGTP